MTERHFLVLLEEEIYCPVSYIRIIHHLTHAPTGWRFSICVLPRESELAGSLIPQVSGVLLARTVSTTAADLAASARHRGLPVIYDLDDFLWRLPDYVGVRELASGADAVLKHASHLMSPSVALIRFVRQRFPHLTATFVANAGDVIVQNHEQNQVTAVMANSDFFRLPALKREFFGALRAAAEDAGVKVWLYYLSNDVPEDYSDDPALQIIWAGVRSYSAYRALLEHAKPEIGLVALPADHFSKYKSVVKYAEFAHHGIAGVYSRVEPYFGFVNDGVDGWLTDNTPEAWREKLSQVLSTPAATRREVAAQARVRTQTEFSAVVWRNRFFQTLGNTGARAVAASAALPNAPPSSREFSFHPAYDYISSVRKGLTYERDEAKAQLKAMEDQVSQLKARLIELEPGTRASSLER